VTVDTQSKILRKLSEMDREEGGLPLLLQFFRELVTAQRSMGPPPGLVPAPDANNDGVRRERLSRGLPLLGEDDLEGADAPLAAAFDMVRDVFRKYPGLFPGVGEENGRNILTAGMVRAWFTGGPMPPAAVNGAAEATIRAMVHFACQPLLEAWAASLSRLVDVEKWRRRFCPVCGGLPDIAYLDRERGSRWLVCARCDFAWLFHRLQCPYCGNEDQTALAFFTDDKGLYRLDVCERCRCYLKTIDLRNTEDDIILPLERLLTAGLDRQAQDEGYRLPG
jgi:hypothetical protein